MTSGVLQSPRHFHPLSNQFLIGPAASSAAWRTTSSFSRAPPRVLPKLSFGPYGLLEAVPWLMLAAAMRFARLQQRGVRVAGVHPVELRAVLRLPARGAAHDRVRRRNDAARQAHVCSDQLLLAGDILRQVVLAAVRRHARRRGSSGYPRQASSCLPGFDGIAFDQFTKLGMLWSAALAAVVLLMVVGAGDGATASLRAAGRELAARWRCLLSRPFCSSPRCRSA